MTRYFYNTLTAIAVCAMLGGGLTGCAQRGVQQPGAAPGSGVTAAVTSVTTRTVAAAVQALTGLERAALAYTSLPACGPAQPAPCADIGIKEQIKAADRVAYAAVVRARDNRGSVAEAFAAIDALRAVIPASPSR